MKINKIAFPSILKLFYLVSAYYIKQNNFGCIMIASSAIQFLLMWSHFQIVFTQPGPITITNTPLEVMEQKDRRIFTIICNGEQLNQICQECKKWKPPKTHHCSTCNRCIHYRDHHCVWFNCCIGYKNFKYFCQFLVYFIILIFLHVTTWIIWFCNKIQQLHNAGLVNFQWSSFFSSVLLEVPFKLVDLLMFYSGYFIVSGLLIDKLVQLPDLTTYNEQKQNKYTYYREFKCNLIRLLGNNPLYWFLPIPNKMTLNYLELTYPKVTAEEDLLDYQLDKKGQDYEFYKIFEIK